MAELAQAQQEDDELNTLLSDDKTSLKLQLVYLSREDVRLHCDVQHELIYGETIHLPREFADDSGVPNADDQSEYLQGLTEMIKKIKPAKASRHGAPVTFMHNDLKTCMHVLLHTDVVKPPLQPPYTGPHCMIHRDAHTLDIVLNGKQATVSLSRVKPAYILQDTPAMSASCSNQHKTTMQNPTPLPPQSIK
ncbi:uncharacterized protein LOC124796353 [Schistocerca piceifrons]|uniref:uncharacterized protein LOC124796353 n=1 Tax=Schistocerca piceifrons TaxID=274613 RepID=UPI001F5F30AA|nr:uncharacterized protein LOC124796353 [Schistocerca piceifrons]